MKLLFTLYIFVLVLISFILPAQKREDILALTNSNNQWFFRNVKEKIYLPAKVPGSVHLDLLKSGKIPDPFFADNETKLVWVEKQSWEYKTNFNVSDTFLNFINKGIVLEGIDGLADVVLNNKYLGFCNNSFRTWQFSVNDAIIKGNNELKIIFYPNSMPDSIIQKNKLPGGERVFFRKPQFQYGWDWAPRIVQSGITNSVYLQGFSRMKMEEFYLSCDSFDLQNAKIKFDFVCYSAEKQNIMLEIRRENSNEVYVQQVGLSAGLNRVNGFFSIKNPKIWWPKGYGNADLETFHVGISLKTFNYQQKHRIGIRKIEWVNENDFHGKSFYCKVNSVPIFLKGANYVPPDVFATRIDSSHYKNIIEDVLRSNFNCLRVWGGGQYEKNYFYDLCDENGILIWQDFMFACAMYPGEINFLANVEQEVLQNIIKLREHPCIAIYCGNNEISEGWHNWGWQKDMKMSKNDSSRIWSDYLKLFQEIIPNAVKTKSPQTFYWPSSPEFGWGRKESIYSGDIHYWGVWWGKENYSAYKNKVGRFVSEYGFQSFPSLSYIQNFSGLKTLDEKNPSLNNHQKHKEGFSIIKSALTENFHTPKNDEEKIYLSQLHQQLALQCAAETHRAHSPYCMGSLYWQFNDCWPSVSWSGIAYNGEWKNMQYQIKRSFNPVYIAFKEIDKSIEVRILNETNRHLNDTLYLALMDVKGNIIQKWKRAINCIPTENSLGYNLDSLTYDALNKKPYFLYAELQSEKFIGSNENINNFYFVQKINKYPFSKPNIKIEQVADSIGISSDVPVFGLTILSDDNKRILSDNAFHLLPGKTKYIKVNKGSPFKKEENITYRCYFQTP